MACTCSYGCPVNEVTRDSFYGRWPMRYRYAYNGDGTGRHTGRQAQRFAAAFYNQVCSPIVRDIDGYSRYIGGPPLAWIGNVGVTVCRSGMHARGRAFDLTRVQMYGWMVDCNTSWRLSAGLASIRRYVAVVATCRYYTGTVLTTWYNTAHQNHIHFDNGVPFTVIRPRMRSDTTLVQASSNVLMGAGLVVDGVWGPLTERAYNALRRRLGLGNQDPRKVLSHTRSFLNRIAAHGFANKGV